MAQFCAKIHKVQLRNKKVLNPTVKSVLLIIGLGTFLTASILAPGLPLALKPFLKIKRENDYKKWKMFNQTRLKQVLKRLQKQKVVQIAIKNGEPIVTLSEKGKKKVLKYNLENLQLENKWDGKWRLIIYDIPKEKKRQSDSFRLLLRTIKCLQLQKSVYLTPFNCDGEIEYIRSLYQIGDNVKILKVSSIENEKAYREYFGI